MEIVFLSPGGSDDPFYGPMIRAMEATAERLGIALRIIACDRDPKLLEARGLELCRQAEVPEYLLLVNENEVGAKVLPRLAPKGSRLLFLSQGMSIADRHTHGKARGQYPSWLGELVPDDRQAGRQLAEILIEAAAAKDLFAADGKLHMIALSGPFTSASILRIGGLRAALADRPDVVLEEVGPAGWDEGRAFTVALDLLERYPQTAIIWAASDSMARGAARAVEELRPSRPTGRDVVIGGIDWAPFVPEMIRRGQITASMGGHFFDGAWALLLLYDFHRGVDFPCPEMKSRMASMHRGNVGKYEQLLGPDSSRDLDLSRFSRALHPAAPPFEIAPDTLLG